MKPLVIDLFCGLGGFSEGFLAEGYRCIGFDVERHDYSQVCPMCDGTGISNGIPDCLVCNRTGRIGEGPYPGHLVLQDVHTIHGSQFRNAACIVASPPCQEFSYMAMPWKRAKQIAAALRGEREGEWPFPFPEGYTGSRTIAQLTALFDACFRIQREASEAAGHHIPMVVENVKGAQPWVGRAQANYGSFYLWGDVRSVGGRIVAAHQVQFGAPGVKAYRAQKSNPDGTQHGTGSWFAVADSKNRGASKNSGGSWFAIGSPGQTETGRNPVHELAGRKVPMNFHEHEKTGKPGRSFQSAAVEDTFGWSKDTALRNCNSKSPARKAASAQIAKIPFELSAHIARCFKPTPDETLRSGYDPERENGAPRRSDAWNRALGWVDALHDEARAWCETKPTPATVNSIAESVNSAGFENGRKHWEGCGK